MAGFQVGCLVSHCEPVKDYMRKRSSLFQHPASYICQMLTTMINDRGIANCNFTKFCIIFLIEWLENTYFPSNLKRLREQLEMTIDWLKKNELPFIRPTGGLYIFVNFTKVRKLVVWITAMSLRIIV